MKRQRIEEGQKKDQRGKKTTGKKKKEGERRESKGRKIV
jgi:hypothetical protein